MKKEKSPMDKWLDENPGKDPFAEWIRDNPMKANLIYPVFGILMAMFTMFLGMQIIDSFLTGDW